jgi:threonine dehydrogenase-like Zn-dependent dehydrogenase
VLPRGFCGACANCRDGRPLFCESGPAQLGGFGERLVIRENAGFRFPDSVSMAEGALVEPIACGRKALRMARLERGASVLVIGAGSMGLAAIFWARRLGAGRVVAATRSSARHAMALAMGADAAVAVSDDDPEAIARAFPAQPDIVVECGGKPGMLAFAAAHVRLGGSVVSLGMCPVSDTVLPAFNTFREISLYFPLAYAAEDFTATIREFDRGTVRPEAIVSQVAPLDRVPAVLEDLRGAHGQQKVQIAPAL